MINSWFCFGGPPGCKDRPTNERAWVWLTSFMLVLSVILVIVRCIHLEADFPVGITHSGELYTDEGWYANAAVRDVTGGAWYVAGDFNPAIDLPVGQLLQRAAFGIFGLNLAAARTTGVVAFGVVIILTGFMVGRDAGGLAGVLTGLILSSHYIGFAYSRLAIMEPLGMAFVAVSLVLAQPAHRKRRLYRLMLSAAVAGAAVLVKGTMAFAIPLIAYMAWRHGRDRQERWILGFVCLVIPAIMVGGWLLVIRHFFYADYVYFNEINLGARKITSLHGWYSNVIEQLRGMLVLGKGFLAASLLLIAGAAILSLRFRETMTVRILIAYGVAYFFLLTTVHYGPPRYFVPLIVPFAGLGAVAAVGLSKWFRELPAMRWLAMVPPLLVLGVSLDGSGRIARYLVQPRYSLVQMSADVDKIVRQREGSTANVMLLGNMADTVAISTGMRAVNSSLGTVPLRDRLRRIHPAYVLSTLTPTSLNGSSSPPEGDSRRSASGTSSVTITAAGSRSGLRDRVG